MLSLKPTLQLTGLFFFVALLSACGGGGGGSKELVTGSKPPPVAVVDNQAPTVIVTSPGDFNAFTVAEPEISIAGVAIDNGTIANVRWATNFGAKGNAIGTTDWSARKVPLESGTTTVTITALDSTGNVSNRFLRITLDPHAVSSNSPPILSGIPASTAVMGEQWTFAPSANDPEGDPLEFSASGLPGWLRLDSNSGVLRGTPSKDDVGIHGPIVVSTSDGIAVVELEPFSITVEDNSHEDGSWEPSLPKNAQIIVEVENHQDAVSLPRGDIRPESGGVIGFSTHVKNGRDQVLLHSWPLQVLLTASGQLAVADLQRNARYVHPEPFDADAGSAFAIECSSSEWLVNVGGRRENIPASLRPPICISSTWGKITVAAADAHGTANVQSPFDMTWFGIEDLDDPLPEPEPVPEPEPEPGPEPTPVPEDRTTFLEMKELAQPKVAARENEWRAPLGSGGIQMTYRPGAIGRTATLLESSPLRIQISATSKVIVSWADDGSQTTLRIPVTEAVGRPLNIHWRCDSSGWSLDADGNTIAKKAAGLPCVDTPTAQTISVGSRQDGTRPIDGQLSMIWYADGTEAPPTSGDTPAPNPENVAFVGDFETGDVSQWNAISEIAKLGYGVNASPGRARNGRFSGRMEVRFLDRGYEDDGTPKKVRAEVLESSMNVGSEWWYGWSSLIDPNWEDQENTWYIIQQFHQHGLGSPPLFQRYAGGKWSIRCLTGICGGNGPLWEERVPKGQWVDFIYNIKWSPDDDGFIRVWKDGEQIVDYRGPTCYEAKRGPYHKFGIYRGGKDEMTQIIWHDEYRRGTSKNAVDPRSYE